MILKALLQEIVSENRITADQIVILEAIFQKDLIFLEILLDVEKQRVLLLQNLIRRGYLGIFDDTLGIEVLENIHTTDKGEQVISELKTKFDSFKDEILEFKKTNFEQKFEEFWELFPLSDKYLTYPRTRLLKIDIERCKRYYRKILDEDIKHEDVIRALKYEIQMRSGMNNKAYSDFKYMKSSATWLNTREFASILEIMQDDSITKIDQFTKDI